MENHGLINATFEPARLRRALRRRQALATRSQLYDHSLPEQFLLHGIVSAPSRAPRIRRGGSLSPYLIHLARSASDASRYADEIPAFAVNLLVPESFLIPVEDVIEAVDDLALEAGDIADQLSEDWAEMVTAQTPSHSPFVRGRIERELPLMPEKGRGVVGDSKKTVETFVVASLAPREAPANFASYLEFPEMEEPTAEETEEEPLDLETLTEESLAPPAPATRPVMRFAFRLPESAPRALAAFVLLSFGFVLPLHAMQFVSNAKDAEAEARKAGGAGLSALSSASSAAARHDPEAAVRSFADAGLRFAQAQDAI